MAAYRLSIFSADATTPLRVTEHPTRRQAERSLYDYERRHGRAPNGIDSMPGPGSSATAYEWDQWRLRNGIAAR